MENNYNEISYSTPNALNINKQEYISQVRKMIQNAIIQEPTIVLHTDEEIAEKYDHSIVAKQNNNIIGNANLYPTQMSELKNLVHPELGELKIGELGSVIVDEYYRCHNVGNNMISHIVQAMSPRYDAVVSATVNERMTKIFNSHGFIKIPFPKDYFEEGKIHLGPKMPGGVEEFTQKAKCFMLFNKDIKDYMLKVLSLNKQEVLI